ncbi:hypothetical protein TTRE_0000301401 [Trichuris trichiura]|uniref:Uncharacterized protein n=1 Tax=Trichuris trichiura TaxID=36087 RepID=A0A077Z4J9_TRITR|nr:hypothetical protein TTRE_0000301401 [Trichuris trichiura]
MVTGHWSLNSSDGIPCIRLQGAIAFNVTYETVEVSRFWFYRIMHNASAKINLPPTAVVLTEESHLMTIGFQDNWWLKFHFTRDSNVTKDDHNDHWLVDSVHLRFTYDKQHFPSARHPGWLFLSARANAGVHVRREILSRYANEFRSIVWVIFFLKNSVESCAADIMTSDLVPIIIGAALAILIVVVVFFLAGFSNDRACNLVNVCCSSSFLRRKIAVAVTLMFSPKAARVA